MGFVVLFYSLRHSDSLGLTMVILAPRTETYFRSSLLSTRNVFEWRDATTGNTFAFTGYSLSQRVQPKEDKMFPFKNINQIDQNRLVLNRTRYQLNKVSDEQQQIRRQHSNNANRSLQQHGLLDGSKTQRQSRSQHDQSKHSGSRGHGMTSHPAQQV